MSQVWTGEETAALPGQEQDPLQQSQYLVVEPVPEVSTADASRVRAARMRGRVSMVVEVW